MKIPIKMALCVLSKSLDSLLSILSLVLLIQKEVSLVMTNSYGHSKLLDLDSLKVIWNHFSFQVVITYLIHNEIVDAKWVVLLLPKRQVEACNWSFKFKSYGDVKAFNVFSVCVRCLWCWNIPLLSVFHHMHIIYVENGLYKTTWLKCHSVKAWLGMLFLWLSPQPLFVLSTLICSGICFSLIYKFTITRG